MGNSEKPPPGKDLMLIAGPEGPGGWVPCVRHRPDHTVTVGAVKPMRDGDPMISGELIAIKEGEGPVHEVETLWAGPNEAAAAEGISSSGNGPVMVNSKAYGDGWDRIFGSAQEVGKA